MSDLTNDLLMEEMTKLWGNLRLGLLKDEVSNNLSNYNKLLPLIPPKENSKNKNTSLKIEKPKKFYLPKINKNEECHSSRKKMPRPCRKQIKEEENFSSNEKTSDEKNELYKQKDLDKLLKSLGEFDSLEGSDSLESDFDEERGFTAADRFLTLNKVAEELEKRGNMKKIINEQILPTPKRKLSINEDKRETFSSDKLANDIVKKFFQEIGEELPEEYAKESKEYRVREKTLLEIGGDETNDVENWINMEKDFIKQVEMLKQNVKRSRKKKTNFEQFFDPLEGVTGEKLHSYLQRQVMLDNKRTHLNENIINKKTDVLKEAGVDEYLDVLHPISTKEKREKLKKLLEDMKTKSYKPKKKKLSEKLDGVMDQLNLKSPSLIKKEAIVLPNIKTDDKSLNESEQLEDEYCIMFSDVEMSDDEEDDKMSSDLARTLFKEKCETVVKKIKDSNKRKNERKTRIERIFERYKRKKDEEKTRRNNEFLRWYGNGVDNSNEAEIIYDIPAWKPGWIKINPRMFKEEIVKNNLETIRTTKKINENETVEECKRLLKEYEQMEEKIIMSIGERDHKKEKQEKIEGAKWIKIKKGTLIKDYQVRWRQGMYYLVERKHAIKKYGKMKKIQKSTVNPNLSYLARKKIKHFDGKNQLFKKKGEAVKEIKKILSLLQSKDMNKKLGKENDDGSEEKKWNTIKFIKYFKEKCKELGAEVSDTEENCTRATFRKYCTLYFQKEIETKRALVDKQELDKYPLGLFKPKKLTENYLNFDKIELSSSDDENPIQNNNNDNNKEIETKKEFEDSLTKELMKFWTMNADEIKNELIENNPYSKTNFLSANDFNEDNFDSQFEYLIKNLLSDPTKLKKVVKYIFAQPKNCSEQLNLSPKLKEIFFGSQSTSNDKIKMPFGNKYIKKEKSYLNTNSVDNGKVHAQIVEEMRNEGLIKEFNYQYLKDDEKIFNWDEINIVPVDSTELDFPFDENQDGHFDGEFSAED